MERYKLGELIDVTRGASLPGDNYATEGELIRLTLGNFDYKSNGFKENTSKEDIYYNGEVDDEYILEKGDIITPLTEQAIGLLGSTAKVPESGKYIQSQDVALVKVKSDKLVHDFAYYLLPTASVKKQLSAGAQQTSIRHTSPDKIKDCTVYLPEPKDQQKIADFLNQIEDKIALNRKENATLEAMAKQLYDYWFVQFDFPDANGRPYKSSGGKMVWNETLKREIPEGWEVKNLGSLFSSNRGISYNTAAISGGGIPMINLASFNIDGEYKNSGLKTYNAEYTEDKLIKPFDLVMCNTQQTAIDFSKDIIGKAFLVPDIFDSPVVSSHHVTTIKPHYDNHKFFLKYLFNTYYFHAYAASCSSGTNILGLDFSGIERYLSEIPEKRIIDLFAEIITEIKGKESILIKENDCLSIVKSTFLPLFVSGQVTIE